MARNLIPTPQKKGEAVANKENIGKWVQALESGEFKQCKSALTVVKDGEESHCCLGVATEIAMRNGVELHTEVIHGRKLYQWADEYGTHGQTSILPVPVQEWLGVDDEDPKLSDHEYGSASGLNDTHKWDFTQIAQAVRATYLDDQTDAG